MKKRILLSFLIISLLLLPSIHVGLSETNKSYSETMKVYVAGQNAFWFLGFNVVNATNPFLSSAESQKGLDYYSISAIRFSGAVSDYQVFGNDGYGVIGLPFIPEEGLFLKIESSDQSTVNSVVSQFDIFLQSALTPYSVTGNNHTFFSPISFDAVAAPKLFRFVPAALGGFASVFTETQFAAMPTPMIRLEGVRTATGFNHRATIGSAVSSAIDASGNLVFANMLRLQPNSSLSSSASSNSTQVYVRTLNGLVVSADNAKVENDPSNFSGYYSLSAPAGKRLKANVSVFSDFPAALGTRILDHGSLNNGDFLSVTLQIQNLGSRATIQNLSVNDDWWKAYGSTFQLATGNASLKVHTIPAGQNFSSTYVLRIIGSGKSDIIIPPTWGSYGYSEKGKVFSGHILFNQAEVRTNDVGPALTLEARTNVGPGTPVGAHGKFFITVRNLGNGPALNVKVLNYSQSSIAQNGGLWKFNVSIPLTRLTETNVTKVFAASWSTPSGESEQASSNRAMALLSSANLRVPFITAATSSTFSFGGTPKSANVTYTISNLGKANSSDISAVQSLPVGVNCIAATGKGSCQGGQITIKPGAVGKTATKTTFTLSFSRAENVVLMPLNLTAKYGGMVLHTYSSPVVIPAGFSIAKEFQPNVLFAGMHSKVVVNTNNAGPLNIYNVTFASPADSFDTIEGKQGRSGLYQLVEANRSFSFNYTVTTDRAQSGSLKAVPINASFVFAGTQLSYGFSQGRVSLYKPLAYSTTTSPRTPIEGRAFSTTFSIDNSAPAAVSQVRLEVSLPAGLQLLNSTADAKLSNGALVISTPQLGPNSSFKVTLSLKASGGLQVDLSKSNLTFAYQGVTVAGQSPKQILTVNEDITTRYAEPVFLAALIMLAVTVFIRRKIPPSAPSSRTETLQKQP